MEVRRFVADPFQEAGKVWVGRERDAAFGVPLEIGVRKIGVERPVADRMDRHGLAPATAFRDRMMPFDPGAERPAAEPAGLRSHVRRWLDNLLVPPFPRHRRSILAVLPCEMRRWTSPSMGRADAGRDWQRRFAEPF